MPSSGKSTVGKLVAEKLSRKFYDTDLLIFEKTGMTPAEIIKGRGEKEFREVESEVISEISKLSGVVIATGGGSILNDENIKNLKKNGLIWFIDRPIESLETGPNRPLSSNKNQLIKRYNERYPKYNACADFVLKDFETPTLAAEQTVKDLCL
jgi:shikimate kinase